MKKILVILVVLVLAGAGVYAVVKQNAGSDEVSYAEIKVKRSDLVEMALAVGTINPDHEVVIKSQVSGIVDIVHREVGEEVEEGEPLMVVKPKPTPLELAEAQRQLELAQLHTFYYARELDRVSQLFKENYISGKEYEQAQQAMQEAQIRENQAHERLELMEEGISKIGDILIESVIRAPTSGTILERLVNVGDPVVPLTSYQPGTELMRLARMDDLIFIGTVDEIDIGKVRPGMRAEIHIGALPEEALVGQLYFISPKSRMRDNVAVFDIKIRILETNGVQLRAGYSASADLIVREKKDVLTIPERLVAFEEDSTYVTMKNAETDTLYRHPVSLGFSDGLTVEIVDGLAEGDTIIEQQ